MLVNDAKYSSANAPPCAKLLRVTTRGGMSGRAPLVATRFSQTARLPSTGAEAARQR